MRWVPPKPWSSTSVSGISPYLSHERSSRHLPPAARLRRRAASLRRRGRVHLARIALDAAGPEPRARRPDPGHLARRRALRGLLRARPRPGDRPPRGPGLHVGDGGRQLRAGGHRGRRGRRPADRPDRRPPAGAARRRRRPDDRPDQAVRVGGEVVLRGRHARRDAGAAALDPPARVPRACGGARRAPRARAPQRRAARAAGARHAAGRRARRRRSARRRAVDRARRRAAGSRAARRVAARARRWPRADRRRPWRGRRRDRSPGRGAGVAAAGRPAVGRAHRRRGDRPLRRAAARRRLGGDRRALVRPARRRPADLQAAAPVAGRRWRATCRSSRSPPRVLGRTPTRR